jgi:hypothetical protein
MIIETLIKLAAQEAKHKWEGKTKNYVVEKLNPPPGKKGIKWRRKVVRDKHGYKHIVNLACKGGKCVATSLWHEKNEPMAKKAKKRLPKLK